MCPHTAAKGKEIRKTTGQEIHFSILLVMCHFIQHFSYSANAKGALYVHIMYINVSTVQVYQAYKVIFELM